MKLVATRASVDVLKNKFCISLPESINRRIDDGLVGSPTARKTARN